MDFRRKKHVSAKCTNGLFSVIPARTRSVDNVGHFLVAQTVQTIFVDDSPKLRVLILAIGHCSKYQKNRMSPWKWPIVWKQKFFRGGPNRKFVAPGVLVMCPVDENCDSKTKNWLLAPNTQIWGHNCTFSSLATNWSLTGHERGVSLVPWFYSLLLR